MWANNYVGIPFKYKGRTKEGLDCWGLVRLIYNNEYNITLPSFNTEYEDADYNRISELIAQYKEGWEQTDTPSVGSIVLFRIMGEETHVGVALSKTHFIHAREGYDSAIEAFESHYWKKRIVGYFNYDQNSGIVLNAVPHPLKTQRYTVPIPAGTRLDILAEWILKEYAVAEEIKSTVHIMVNGNIVDKTQWAEVTLLDNDVVEYRAVATGGSTTRTFLTLAVMAVAYLVIGPAAAEFAGYSGVGAMTATQAGAAFVASTAAVYVGMRLVDYIAPIRMPTTEDPGSSERQLMVEGASNQATPYGSIPVVLGKVKITPPLGAYNYLTYEDGRDSYLSMLLVWGYGPLTIYQDTLKIGEQPITNYIKYNLINYEGKNSEYHSIVADDTGQITNSIVQKDAFDAIYGKDITQTRPNLELVCKGEPLETGLVGPWAEAISTEVVDSVTLALHFPQGLRSVKNKGDGAGSSYAATVSFDIEYYATSWVSLGSITLGSDAPKKDAFTYTKTFSIYDGDIPANNGISIRIRRTTGSNIINSAEEGLQYYFTSLLHAVTFTRNAAPALDPIGAKIAKSAFKIKATDQLNGSIEGLNAIVQTYCKSWNGSAWVDAASNNPADLFRYVLEHSGNAQRITDIASKVNLTQLQYWATYCNTKGFTYNSILGSSKGLLDVLRDICAAGRASPALVDGKWTVTIDEPKANIIQHFTPHNSWGFESTKALPKLPDGLRVTYFDEDNNYQESEIIVYALGKSKETAAIFESIQLPGVTKKTSVIDHAKWHMAQAKLRPEIYTLNVDIEYLVCNRGDRVKVAHDIPMWGLASGRIKNRISSTVLELDEEVPMQSGLNYTIRVRSANGGSVVRNVQSVGVDGYYSQITLTSSTTSAEVNASDLFMFGELDSEAQDLIVLSIEPTTNKSARLTLVDYGVTDTYNIFTDYLTLTASTVFESQITLPPKLILAGLGDSMPTITKLVSDESVMEKISDGAFKYNLKVSYTNDIKLPATVASVQVQYDYAASTDSLNYNINSTDYTSGSVLVPNVVEGETYKVRLRYVTSDGRFGKWTEWANNTIVGKTSLPSQVTNFNYEAELNTGRLRLSWDNNSEIDIKGYEVRTANTGWGTSANRVFSGSTNTCSTLAEDAAHSTIYYIRAFDYGNNYSATSTTITYTAPLPQKPTNLTYVYGSSSNTHSTVTFSWEPPSQIDFTIKEYKLTINKPDKPAEVLTTASTKYISNADWIGNAIISIEVVDISGNVSPAATLTVPKYAPSPIVSFNSDVVDNNVLLRWVLPNKTSLPISHILIKRGVSWEAADKIIGEKSGTFTSIFELAGGDYTYWLAVVDTDNRESTPTPIALTVSQPPDFVFNAKYVSTLQATKINVSNITNSTSLLMLVNNSETWAQHFSNRAWNTPQDQINASYPIYSQPDTTPAYYQEVFNYGQLLPSSSITVEFTGSVVSGTPSVYTAIETSIDGSNWSSPQKLDAIFATNFQYIRVTINALANTTTDLYKLDKLVVRLDNKQISDSDNITCLLADSLGTIVNFNKEFIEVQSINLTAAGTTPLTAVYDFKDEIISGTYSISFGTITVNATAHGLITGQKVRLAFSSGSGTSGVYTITKITDNQYTATATGQPNTSGAVVTYAQSMRVYVFNSTSGIRQDAKVGWSIKGY